MSRIRPRVSVPKSATPGEIITIKALISHPMESGQRRDRDGALIPRKIINRFDCTFNGDPVLSCAIDPAISANPFFEFNAKVDVSGTFAFKWVDDDGSVYEDAAEISVG
ncbi:MAG: thiosulfate oxidation carrier complex protein SoxZ [Paracoccaceae bacterium]|nr:thiosulfate oxidation carrier complex protein SoxZ [Paracoccaceae bacterium]